MSLRERERERIDARDKGSPNTMGAKVYREDEIDTVTLVGTKVPRNS